MYRYGLNYRPAGWGNTPGGDLVELRDPEDKRFRFGTIAFASKLDPQLVSGYELVDVAEHERIEKAKETEVPRLTRILTDSSDERARIEAERELYKLGIRIAHLPNAVQDAIDDRSMANLKAREETPKAPEYKSVTTKKGGQQLTFLNPAASHIHLITASVLGLVLFGWLEKRG